MKTKYLPLVLAAFLLPGCASLSTTSQQRIFTAAKLATYVGTAEYLRQNPPARQLFAEAALALALLETSEHPDLPTLVAVVNRLPLRELKSDRAQMIITASAILLSDYVGQIPTDKLDQIKPLAAAIREGINLALGP